MVALRDMRHPTPAAADAGKSSMNLAALAPPAEGKSGVSGRRHKRALPVFRPWLDITGRGVSNVSLPIVRLLPALPGGPPDVPGPGGTEPASGLPTTTWDHFDEPLDELGIVLDEVILTDLNRTPLPPRDPTE